MYMQVLQSVDEFPTCVTICIVTDRAPQMEQVLTSWPSYRQAKVCAEVQESQPYDLLWEHRHVMAEAYQTGTISPYAFCKPTHGFIIAAVDMQALYKPNMIVS